MREKLPKSQQTKHRIGSPRRVQGKVFSEFGNAKELRITPACAGKRSSCGLLTFRHKDHPCVCREKELRGIHLHRAVGSPLRVQGKAQLSPQLHQADRITPACAGKRLMLTKTSMPIEDHPCVCREKACIIAELSCCLGSPLRVKGKACVSVEGSNPGRITPACAGKRLFIVYYVNRNQDHPCVCREKSAQSA